MVALNFNSTVGHFINGLVDHNRSMRLSHYLVNLIAFGADQKRNHPLRHKYYYREVLPSNFLENVVNVGKKASAALILLLHLLVINLQSLLYVLEYYGHSNQGCLNQG